MKDDYFIYGIHAVYAALTVRPSQCLELFIREGREGDVKGNLAQLREFAIGQKITISPASKQTLDDLAAGLNHQGVVLKCSDNIKYREQDLELLLENCMAQPLVLVLDGVQDPHNLGACLRTAESLGVDVVVAPKDRACDLTPVVRKVASGAAERMPFIRVTNLSRTLDRLQSLGLWVTGAAGEVTTKLHTIDFTGGTVLVMGGEGKGLREGVRKACDHLAAIPMQGAVGSFNVSVACGICLYEIARQRSAKPRNTAVE